MNDAHLKAIANADPYPYWLDDVDEPDSNETLVRTESCDLCVIGGGYTGLWTAIIAKQRDPSRNVVLLEAGTIASAASGRNGGFMEASLTHGIANGQQRFPDEMARLEQLALENLNEIEAVIKQYDIDCDYERVGSIDVAVHPNQVGELRDDYEQLRNLGQPVELFDRDAMQREIHSPTYHGGLWRKDRAALIDPARLAWGLKDVAEGLGVRIYEDSKVTKLERDGVGVLATTPLGRVRAGRVAMATNAFPPLVRSARKYIIPVYDYCMVTEPLNEAQREAIGWKRRQGLSDTTNQFHYYRLTEDNRILWGGYDAIYYFGGKVNPVLDARPETWARLSEHFFTTFPQLEGIEFTHVWGGAIDTCTRFCVFWDRVMNGRVVYALGFTGLGVASTRFGAEVMLDLLDGKRSRATELQFVQRKPVPFPPEPLKWAGVQLTRWSINQADHNGGRRNLWLKALDRFGLGFDS